MASKPQTIEELLASAGKQLQVPRKGTVIEGVITDITKKMVIVDIGGKTEGVVVDKEYELAQDFIGDLAVGDTISVYVISAENDRGQTLLSLKKAAMDKKWDMFIEAMKNNL